MSTSIKRPSKSEISSTIACFDELKNAIDILNATESTKKVRSYCNYSDIKNENSFIIDKTTIHYVTLIKQAVAKHKWNHVCKLLLAFLKEPKGNTFFTQVIFNITLIFLLNDPVAQNNRTLNEFLELAVSCHDDKDKSKLLKKIMTIPRRSK